MVDFPILSPIHTPEVRCYALAALAVCGVSCTALAAHLHARWFAARHVEFLTVHAAVLAVIVAAAAGILAPAGVIGKPGWGVLWLSPLSALGGWLAVRGDRAIVRRYSRLRARNERAAGGAHLGRLTPQIRSVQAVFGRKQGSPRVVGAERMQERWDPMPGGMRLRLPWLLAVALLEELVFRGFLVQLLCSFSSVFVLVAGLIGVGLVFCLSHVFFGWAQVLAKVPLCVVATVLAVAAGSPLLAVIAHLYFNFMTWKDATNAVLVNPTRETHLQLLR
jgi:membrane protease YdiL (CAAX protease family)